MTTPETEEWYSMLSPGLLRRAYREPHGELAWSRSDALLIVAMLQDQQRRILGVDAWLPTRPGPTPLIRDWNANSPISPADFIKTFDLIPIERSDPKLEPHFNFTVA